MVGRDPREMTPAELEAMGHARMSKGAMIRARCLDCCAGSPHEVRLCVAVACPSWPRRMGGPDPWRPKPSAARLEALRERGRALARRIDSGLSKPDKIKAPDAGTVGDDASPPPRGGDRRAAGA
jgi:hypothetical protein